MIITADPNSMCLCYTQKSPYEEEELLTKDKCTYLQEDSKDDTGGMDTRDTIDENNPSRPLGSNPAETPKQRISRLSRGLRSKITNLQIPERNNVFDIFKKETLPPSCRALIPDSPSDDGYETAEESFLSEEEFMVPKSNIFGEEEDNYDRPIPKEKILRRIVSHKEMKSYQLAKQLTSRWTTGAGPRIGCMRDYPQELQNSVLEQAQLSPRGRVVQASHSRTQSRIGSMASTPNSCKDTSTARSPLAANCLVLSQTAPPSAECN